MPNCSAHLTDGTNIDDVIDDLKACLNLTKWDDCQSATVKFLIKYRDERKFKDQLKKNHSGDPKGNHAFAHHEAGIPRSNNGCESRMKEFKGVVTEFKRMMPLKFLNWLKRHVKARSINIEKNVAHDLLHCGPKQNNHARMRIRRMHEKAQVENFLAAHDEASGSFFIPNGKLSAEGVSEEEVIQRCMLQCENPLGHEEPLEDFIDCVTAARTCSLCDDSAWEYECTCMMHQKHGMREHVIWCALDSEAIEPRAELSLAKLVQNKKRGRPKKVGKCYEMDD